MTTYVALVRGINVGGQKKIKMEELKAIFVALGHLSVSTYIQSGNVVFKSSSRKPGELAKAIEERIAGDLHLEVSAVLRTHSELAKVVAGNPFLRADADTSRLYVSFLADKPGHAALGDIDAEQGERCELSAGAREIYLQCPQGYGRTKLNNAFWERRLGVTATTRNWNTTVRLLQLSGA